MNARELRLEHSVDVHVSPTFAWAYRTNIANWNDPPATFALDGPFATGTRGTTQIPGQDAILWLIREVRPEQSFVIEMQLEGATLNFEWHFEPLSQNKTKMTQAIVLSGENAAAYSDQIEKGFGPTLAPGMKRIAGEMVAAQLKSKNAG